MAVVLFALIPGCLLPEDRGEAISRNLRVEVLEGSGIYQPQTGNQSRTIDDCGAGAATMGGRLEDVEQGSVSVVIQRPGFVLHDATYRAEGEYSRELELPKVPVVLSVAWNEFIGDLEFGVECLR